MSKQEKVRKIDAISWEPILIGSIAVWIMGCSQKLTDLIKQEKLMLLGVMVSCYLVAFFYIVIWKKKRDSKTILGLIFVGGFLLRAFYVLAAPYNITKHDTGSFIGFHTKESGEGHFGYIEYLYKNHCLPDFDPRTKYSFYNPPAFYVVEAIILGITRLFSVKTYLSYESLQVVTLFFSSLTIWTSYRILKEFEISDKWMVLWLTFLAAHPFYSIMAVTLNNDCMTMYFMSLAIWYTIRWHKSQKMKDIIIIALAVGVSMCTKLNAAVLSFGIGAVFICVFCKKVCLYVYRGKKNNFRYILLQFLVFLMVCAPIGLFNPIRNMVKFDMPPGYIQKVSKNSVQFIADSTPVSRLGIPTWKQMSYSLICYDTEIERNVWIQMLRTALFDELNPDVGNSLVKSHASILLWLSILLVILFNGIFIRCIMQKNTMQQEIKLFLVVGYLALLVSYVVFCMKEPFICTMNYRYIPVAMLFPLIGTAVYIQKNEGNGGRKMKKKNQFVINVLVYSMAWFVAKAVVINFDLILFSGVKL